MATNPCLLILSIVFAAIATAAGYNCGVFKKPDMCFSLHNYCESWRMNVELHNIRNFAVVPSECVSFIGHYMASAQYKFDVQRTTEEVALYLNDNLALAGDGMDAWIFDVDDTLLSTEPYYKNRQLGAGCGSGDQVKTNRSSLEEWMQEGNAPAVEHMLDLYYEVRWRGLKIFIISARGEHLRDATIDNLIMVGYQSWTRLILRCEDEMQIGIVEYKAEQRKALKRQGYRLWGIVGDQWSSLGGLPRAKRSFKLPNPMYYDA